MKLGAFLSCLLEAQYQSSDESGSELSSESEYGSSIGKRSHCSAGSFQRLSSSFSRGASKVLLQIEPFFAVTSLHCSRTLLMPKICFTDMYEVISIKSSGDVSTFWRTRASFSPWPGRQIFFQAFCFFSSKASSFFSFRWLKGHHAWECNGQHGQRPTSLMKAASSPRLCGLGVFV